VKNIFVGNLSFGATEDAVRSMFEAYGTVDRVSVVTDRETGRAAAAAVDTAAAAAAADDRTNAGKQVVSDRNGGGSRNCRPLFLSYQNSIKCMNSHIESVYLHL
jgi:hypothetical protein